MHAGDRSQTGWMIARHHDRTVSVPMRRVPGLARLLEDDQENRPIFDLLGDLCGAAGWAEVDNRRDGVNAWFLTGAPVYSNTTAGTSTDKGWSLLRDLDTRDERLESKDLGVPEWFEGTFPKSHTGQGSAAVEEGAQVDLLHPDFWGLYAPQKFGPPSTGTFVFDLDDESKPDKDRAAQLQQLVRVADLGPGLCGFGGKTLALQLGPEDLERKSGGLWFAEGGNTAAGTSAAGGPFLAGAGFCQHQSAGPDGALTPLHLSTSALFMGLEGDAPLHFEPDRYEWGPLRDEGIPTKVHLALATDLDHRAGCVGGRERWAWYTRVPHFVGEPPRQPPPRQPPPPPPGDEFPPPVTGDEPPPPVTGDGEQFVFNPYPPRRIGDATDPKQGLVSDGGKPVYASSPYCQTAPGYVFRPQHPGYGTVLAADNVNGWHVESPQVGGLVAFGNQSGLGWTTTRDTTDTQHAAGVGGFALVPPDIDPFALFRGETVTSPGSLKPQFVIPDGFAQLGFGSVLTGGLVGSGMLLETGTGGRLDIKTVDSTGAVTATAYIPSGSSGDITGGGGGGGGDVTGPASSTTGNLPSFADGTGKLLQDSGIASSDVIGGATGGTDNAVLRADGTGGSTVQSTGITVDDSDLMNGADGYGMNERITAPATSGRGIWVDNSYSTALLGYWSNALEWLVPFVSKSGIADGDFASWDDPSKSWVLTPAGGGTLPTAGTAKQILQDSGSAWVAQSNLDVADDPGAGNSAHSMDNTYDSGVPGSGANALAIALECASSQNTAASGFNQVAVHFSANGGAPCGYVGGRKQSSIRGNLEMFDHNGTRFFQLENSSSLASVLLNEIDGVIELQDSLTSGTINKFSGATSVYVKNGDVYINPNGGSEVQVTGSGSVEADYQNSASVSTTTTADGEVLVYDSGSGGMVAQDINTQSGEGGSSRVKKTASNTVTATSGASVTLTNLIPAGVRVIAVTVVVTTSLGTSNGTTGFQVGDGSTVDRWGTDTGATTSGTSTGPDDYGTTADQCCFWQSSTQSVVLTAVGGNFDGTGEFRCVVYYEEINKPTS